MIESPRILLRFTTVALLASSLLACGGGNSGDSGNTSSVNPAGNGGGNNTTPKVAKLLTAGSPAADTVSGDDYNLYKVPSGSEIILEATTGDVGLYLYTSLELEDDDLICIANSRFKEKACTATVADNELYALVYGREQSNYNISVSNDCSVNTINKWVDRSMRDYYLYYEQIPVVNPDNYTDPMALVAELRHEDLDPYSNIQNAASQSTFFEQGVLKGLGYRWRFDNNNLPRVSRVYTDSPFGRAGVNRGDIIVSINGVAWETLTFEKYIELTGTEEDPLTATWRFIDNETNNNYDVDLTLGDYTVNTVLRSQKITHPGYSGSIGYIAFSSFIETSEAELDTVFEDFKASGVTDLILDLRYNGGGRTSIARQLASQISGPATNGEPLITYQYNNKYSNLDFSRNFEQQPHSLGLTRLIVLTSDATASSSEIVINSLRPYIEVITIGTKTEGKPYISSSNNFCGKTLNVMEAQGVNANGVSVAGGITADCYAADDVTKDFGVNNGVIEGMLGAAADYVVFGSCAAASLAKHETNDFLADHVSAFVREQGY